MEPFSSVLQIILILMCNVVDIAEIRHQITQSTTLTLTPIIRGCWYDHNTTFLNLHYFSAMTRSIFKVLFTLHYLIQCMACQICHRSTSIITSLQLKLINCIVDNATMQCGQKMIWDIKIILLLDGISSTFSPVTGARWGRGERRRETEGRSVAMVPCATVYHPPVAVSARPHLDSNALVSSS